MIKEFLRRIEEEQAKLAKAAMMSPKSDLFEYGRMVGIYGGLETAKGLLMSAYEDKEDRDNKL